MGDLPIPENTRRRARQKSIDKNVAGAIKLAFFAYLNRDQESLDVADLVMRECGYPKLDPIR